MSEQSSASDAKAVSKRVAAVRRESERVSRGICAVLATPDTRAFVWDLLASCGLYETSFHTNALTMAFGEGKRDVGLKLVAQIMEFDQEAYLTMQREAANREKEND